jgi:hypothetical protein
MFITIADSLLDTIKDQPSSQGKLYANIRDDGDVFQIKAIDDHTKGHEIGYWVKDEERSIEEITKSLSLHQDQLLLLWRSQQAEAYQVREGKVQVLSLSIIRLHADYLARLRGLFETDRLAQTRIAIIGLGSGGSVVATQLARCGVGSMRLVDFDRLEVHNIARHACNLSDVGRYKTRALRDLLLNISPSIELETFEVNILDQQEELITIVEGCDLVVAATDSEQSKSLINQVCWPKSIPVVYGAAYNRAFGGDIFRAIPGDNPCYTCFQEAVAEYFGPPPAATDDFSPAYEDPSRMADLLAEPGLGVDIGIIAHLMAQMTLLTLVRGTTTSLVDFPSDWLVFGNRAEWIFEKPLESLFFDIPKNPICPTCNYEAFLAEKLGMTKDEVKLAAQKILNDLPSMSM